MNTHYDPFDSRSLPEWRYQHDIKFKQYVDLMNHLIHRAELTPTEVREAAMLACIHYGSCQMRRIYLDGGQFNVSALKKQSSIGGHMSTIALLLSLILLTSCTGLDPKNEGFAENAGEVVGRTFLGVMTLGISERVIAEDRKFQRIRERQEVQRQKWYDGLSDQEKNIEDMREAHRYQLMGTIMQGNPFPTMQLMPPPAYTIPQSTVPPAVQRPQANCTSSVMGSQITTNCY